MALTDEKRKVLAQLLQNRQGAQAPPTPQRGGGFEPSALIAEGGGLAGAATGASIGAVGGPVGSLIGAGIGGLIGGFGGSVAEQKVRDKDVDLGEAAKFAAIEGLFSAGPVKLFRAGKQGFKLAKAGGQASKATRGGVDDLSEALQSSTRRAGESLTGGARGITAGQRLSGQRLRPEKVKELNKFLTDTVNVRAASSPVQLEDLGKFISKKSDEFSSAIQKADRQLSPSETTALMNRIKSRFESEVVGANPTQRRIAADLAKRVAQNPRLSTIDEVRKLAQKNVNFARNSKLPKTEQVMEVFRRELTDNLSRFAPKTAKPKSQLAKAYQAEELLLNKAASKVTGFNPAGISPPARAAQGISARTGRGLEVAGQQLERTDVPALAARTGAASAVAGGGDTTEPTLPSIDDTEGELGDIEALLAGQEQQTSQLTQDDINQAILMDLEETGGENVEQIQLIAEMFGPQVGELDGKMETAKTIVDNLMQVYQDVGGPKGAYGGRAASALGALNVGEANEQARAYEQNRMSYLTPIIKAFGEVGVLTDKDREVIAEAIPSVNDTPAQAEQKINLLYQMLESLSASGGETQSAGDDSQALIETLSQLGL